jgi:hypothetical protein
MRYYILIETDKVSTFTNHDGSRNFEIYYLSPECGEFIGVDFITESTNQIEAFKTFAKIYSSSNNKQMLLYKRPQFEYYEKELEFKV